MNQAKNNGANHLMAAPIGSSMAQMYEAAGRSTSTKAQAELYYKHQQQQQQQQVQQQHQQLQLQQQAESILLQHQNSSGNTHHHPHPHSHHPQQVNNGSDLSPMAAASGGGTNKAHFLKESKVQHGQFQNQTNGLRSQSKINQQTYGGSGGNMGASSVSMTQNMGASSLAQQHQNVINASLNGVFGNASFQGQNPLQTKSASKNQQRRKISTTNQASNLIVNGQLLSQQYPQTLKKKSSKANMLEPLMGGLLTPAGQGGNISSGTNAGGGGSSQQSQFATTMMSRTHTSQKFQQNFNSASKHPTAGQQQNVFQLPNMAAAALIGGLDSENVNSNFDTNQQVDGGGNNLNGGLLAASQAGKLSTNSNGSAALVTGFLNQRQINQQSVGGDSQQSSSFNNVQSSSKRAKTINPQPTSQINSNSNQTTNHPVASGIGGNNSPKSTHQQQQSSQHQLIMQHHPQQQQYQNQQQQQQAAAALSFQANKPQQQNSSLSVQQQQQSNNSGSSQQQSQHNNPTTTLVVSSSKNFQMQQQQQQQQQFQQQIQAAALRNQQLPQQQALQLQQLQNSAAAATQPQQQQQSSTVSVSAAQQQQQQQLQQQQQQHYSHLQAMQLQMLNQQKQQQQQQLDKTTAPSQGSTLGSRRLTAMKKSTEKRYEMVNLGGQQIQHTTTADGGLVGDLQQIKLENQRNLNLGGLNDLGVLNSNNSQQQAPNNFDLPLPPTNQLHSSTFQRASNLQYAQQIQQQQQAPLILSQAHIQFLRNNGGPYQNNQATAGANSLALANNNNGYILPTSAATLLQSSSNQQSNLEDQTQTQTVSVPMMHQAKATSSNNTSYVVRIDNSDAANHQITKRKRTTKDSSGINGLATRVMTASATTSNQQSNANATGQSSQTNSNNLNQLENSSGGLVQAQLTQAQLSQIQGLLVLQSQASGGVLGNGANNATGQQRADDPNQQINQPTLVLEMGKDGQISSSYLKYDSRQAIVTKGNHAEMMSNTVKNGQQMQEQSGSAGANNTAGMDAMMSINSLSLNQEMPLNTTNNNNFNHGHHHSSNNNSQAGGQSAQKIQIRQSTQNGRQSGTTMSHLDSKNQKNLNLTIPMSSHGNPPPASKDLHTDQSTNNVGGSTRKNRAAGAIYSHQNGASALGGPEEQKRVTLERMDSEGHHASRPPQTSAQNYTTATAHQNMGGIGNLEDDDNQSLNLSVNDRESHQSKDGEAGGGNGPLNQSMDSEGLTSAAGLQRSQQIPRGGGNPPNQQSIQVQKQIPQLQLQLSSNQTNANTNQQQLYNANHHQVESENDLESERSAGYLGKGAAAGSGGNTLAIYAQNTNQTTNLSNSINCVASDSETEGYFSDVSNYYGGGGGRTLVEGAHNAVDGISEHSSDEADSEQSGAENPAKVKGEGKSKKDPTKKKKKRDQNKDNDNRGAALDQKMNQKKSGKDKTGGGGQGGGNHQSLDKNQQKRGDKEKAPTKTKDFKGEPAAMHHHNNTNTRGGGKADGGSNKHGKDSKKMMAPEKAGKGQGDKNLKVPKSEKNEKSGASKQLNKPEKGSSNTGAGGEAKGDKEESKKDKDANGESPVKKKKKDKIMQALIHVVPKNIEEQKEAFFESEFTVNPIFEYANPDLALKVRQSFKEPSDEFLDLSKRILDSFIETYGSESAYLKTEGDVVPRDETLEIFQKYLEDLDFQDMVQICLKPNQVAPTSVSHDPKTGKSQVNIRDPPEYNRGRILGVLDHEIGTHYMRRLNEKQQIWYKKRDKFEMKQCLATEEGLACVNQMVRTVWDGKHPFLYRSALNYYAAYMSSKLSFVELFNDIEKYIDNPRARWKFTLRLKRGVVDTSEPGGLYKDQCYLVGAVHFLQERKTIDIESLYCGKLDLEDLKRPKIQKILNKQKLFLPPFVEDLEAYNKALDVIALTNHIPELKQKDVQSSAVGGQATAAT